MYEFHVWRQYPQKHPGLLNLILMKWTIHANTGAEAIALAKKHAQFAMDNKNVNAPIVQRIDAARELVYLTDIQAKAEQDAART